MVHPEKKRFYWLMLKQDLLGTWCLVKVYGGLTNNHRREVWVPYNSKVEADQALLMLEQARRKRGYVYADIDNVDHFALRPQTVTEVLMG